MEFGVLGPVGAWQHGEPVPLGGAPRRCVLGVLLLSLLTSGGLLFTVTHARARQEMAIARELEAVARARAEAALQAERARQEADRKKE